MRTMRHLLAAAILAFAVPSLVVSIDAQARPKNATAQCKDGSYSTAKTKQGACSKHGGVQTWFADEKPPTTAAPKSGTASTPQTANDAPKTPAPKTPAPGTATKNASGAPGNATAKCKDGTYSYAKQHSGACSHHGGVAEWYK
jgi:hypothetical protein